MPQLSQVRHLVLAGRRRGGDVEDVLLAAFMLMKPLRILCGAGSWANYFPAWNLSDLRGKVADFNDLSQRFCDSAQKHANYLSLHCRFVQRVCNFLQF